MHRRNPAPRSRLSAAAVSALTAITLVAGALPGFVGSAAAAPAAPVRWEPPAQPVAPFYVPPAPLPAGADGALLRTEPSTIVPGIDLPGGRLPGTGTRLMYLSRDAHDQPTAITGTYLEPSTPWTGPGSRPLISLAVGTQGQGDQCAPSKLLNTFVSFTPPADAAVDYEFLNIANLMLRGYAVVMTDYEGLGTPGVHTYVNRAAEAHAVLDAVRAARNLPGTSLRPDSPLGLWGYSQGGGAVAAAAELAPTYAPELRIAGTYAGAPPADLAATLAQVDGSSIVGVIGYTINGLRRTNPEIEPIIDAVVSDAGRAMLDRVATQCIGETALTYGFRSSSEFTRSGRPLSEVLKDYPELTAIFAENRIGNRTPTSPVYIDTGVADDIVPTGQAQQLARDWCAAGATVSLNVQSLPPIAPRSAIGHALPDVLGLAPASTWMADRLAGRPASSTC